MFSTALQRAIDRGLKPGGDLAKELRALDDYEVRSKKDARAICRALGKLPVLPGVSGFDSPLNALVEMFQRVESSEVPAYDILYREGLPQLVRIVESRLPAADRDTADDLLFVLKILAMYGSRKGAEKVIEAARVPLLPDSFLWHAILSFFHDHPHRELVYEALGDSLPEGFMAVALLDSANRASIESGLARHPFDSPDGWQRLGAWFADRRPKCFSYARSATVALPFLSNPARDQLLALAMDHVDPLVQLEAAWAAGKLGREAGLKRLARFCLDVNYFATARHYLAELKREELLPPECGDPSFQAKATFANWLMHPNELGEPADELEVVDHRSLLWPSNDEPEPFWIIRYRHCDRYGVKNDDVDCGVVGSMTWCFFIYQMHLRPPEDVYAIHAYWEMKTCNDIVESDLEGSSEYDGMLAQWQGPPLRQTRLEKVAELSQDLEYPQVLVALASAECQGEAGWVVLDGPRSAWYPRSEQPEDSVCAVLGMHVGRQLLRFREPVDRRKYLVNEPPGRRPEEVVAAFEKLLHEVETADVQRQEELFGRWGVVAPRLNHYLAALVAVSGRDEADVLADVYRRLMQVAEKTDASLHADICDEYGVFGGEPFEKYVNWLAAHDEQAEIAALVELFAPHWDHSTGYRDLALAAVKAGKQDVAERFLLKLRANDGYYFSDEMSLLAEIWHDQGKTVEARELLVDCLCRLRGEFVEVTSDDSREQCAESFRHHCSTLLRLFPGGEQELARLGVPLTLGTTDAQEHA